MRRLKVLISAYACEPGKGSEPGRGWFTAREMSKYFDVWVLTRKNNEPAIAKERLSDDERSHLQFVYFDLAGPLLKLKRGAVGTEFYYYLWQLGSMALVRRLDREIDFDVVQHATFNRYWSPSNLSILKKPFIWGQVGGAESTPPELRWTLGFRGIAADFARNFVRGVAEVDPLLRRTARKSTLALGGTTETCRRLRKLGAKTVELLPGSGLSRNDIETIGALPPPSSEPFRLVSVGRLIAWKGYHLSIEAFAKSHLEKAEYWIVGDGPERARLEALAKKSEAGDRILFLGARKRAETLQILGQCSVLLHPSLHDSAGWAYLEGMAAGRPVVCFNIGGGATQITDECGVRIEPGSPATVIQAMSSAIISLANDPDKVTSLGANGKQRVGEVFDWSVKMEAMASYYRRVAGDRERS